MSLVRPCVGLHFNYYTISYVYESDFILKIFFFSKLVLDIFGYSGNKKKVMQHFELP